ncbi:MAG: MATE family efflux transporter, partial [Bacteroidia bacterium]|nr:MATE family efflux transporter [Bacteroidia bacterium]
LRKQKYKLSISSASLEKWTGALLRYAGPAVLQNIIGMAGWLVFFLLIERRGAIALAAANVIRSIYSFCMLPTWALATAVGTLVGYFWGARQPASLLAAFRRTWIISQSIGTGTAFFLALLSREIVGLFTRDAVVAQEAQEGLYLIAISLVLMPASALLLSAVVAVGKVVTAFIVEVVVILAYIGYAFWMHTRGVKLLWMWTAEWVYWIPSAIILGLIFMHRLSSLAHKCYTIRDVS